MTLVTAEAFTRRHQSRPNGLCQWHEVCGGARSAIAPLLEDEWKQAHIANYSG